jgi:hypothetical protein
MDWSYDESGGPRPEHEAPSSSLARPIVTTIVAIATLLGTVLAFAASFPVLGGLLLVVVVITGWAAGVAWTDRRRLRSART